MTSSLAARRRRLRLAAQRPGAQLWSIAAGPLGNVMLVPITPDLCFSADRNGLG